jgi:hypothetical protein
MSFAYIYAIIGLMSKRAKNALIIVVLIIVAVTVALAMVPIKTYSAPCQEDNTTKAKRLDWIQGESIEDTYKGVKFPSTDSGVPNQMLEIGVCIPPYNAQLYIL